MRDLAIPLGGDERGDLTDRALLGACAAGDNLALRELLQRHAERVYGVLVRTRRVDDKDLDDLVQLTFIAVQRSAKSFDARASVGTWIVSIAMNLMRNYLRNERRRRLTMSAVAELHRSVHGNDPHDQVARRQDLARLQRRFEALPSRLRTVLALVDLEGKSGVEVARALQLAEGTVWSRLHKAREYLRQSIEEGGRPYASWRGGLRRKK